MVKVRLTQNYLEHQAGDEVSLDNNIAHGLIERGAATLVTGHENRMAGGRNRNSEPRVK